MTEHQPTSSHNTNTGPDSARRTASELQQIIAAEHIPPPDDAPEPPEQTIDHLSLPDYANVPYPDTEPPVSQADVEEAFKQQAEALRQAHIDELTGIPNRLGLDKNLQSLWGVSDSDPHYVPNYQRESPGPHHAIVVRLDMGELKLAMSC